MKTLKKLSLPLFLTFVAGIFVYAYLAITAGDGKISCPINAFFHLHCLTCGTTRAAYWLLAGEIKTAFYYNALFTVGIVPFTIIVSAYLLNFSLEKRVLPLPKPRIVYLIVLFSAAVAFTVIRNMTNAIY